VGAWAASLQSGISVIKQLTVRVVTTKAETMVGVEVAHDPENWFRVGDVVELLRSRTIST
jgi:hypothetical protein